MEKKDNKSVGLRRTKMNIYRDWTGQCGEGQWDEQQEETEGQTGEKGHKMMTVRGRKTTSKQDKKGISSKDNKDDDESGEERQRARAEGWKGVAQSLEFQAKSSSGI